MQHEAKQLTGVPRLLTKDYTHSNYHFPRGAVVHVLDIALSQSPTTYSSSHPSLYDPSRWLDPSSPNFRAPLTEHPRLKAHHIFGRGKRVCPGQDLAEAELLVFCGNLVKNFELGKRDGVEIGPENWTPHVIGGPLPFPCEIKARDVESVEAIGK
jgi:cytochrome P450